MLRLHAEGASGIVNLAALANEFSVQEISGVELQTGFGSNDFQHAATGRIMDAGSELQLTRFFVQNPIMIVTFAEFELLILLIDTRADGGRFAEIKGRPFDRPQFA